MNPTSDICRFAMLTVMLLSLWARLAAVLAFPVREM